VDGVDVVELPPEVGVPLGVPVGVGVALPESLGLGVGAGVVLGEDVAVGDGGPGSAAALCMPVSWMTEAAIATTATTVNRRRRSPVFPATARPPAQTIAGAPQRRRERNLLRDPDLCNRSRHESAERIRSQATPKIMVAAASLKSRQPLVGSRRNR
jgi:hypothetical protein